MLDPVAALRWLRANVAAFGGDPDNVTLLANPPGATNIGYRELTARARTVPPRREPESAASRMQDRLDGSHAGAAGVALSAQLAGEPDLAALRRLSSREIWEATLRHVLDHPHAGGRRQVGPCEPGAGAAGEGIPYDLLIGSNEDKWYMYVDADPQGLAKDLPAAIAPAARGSASRRGPRGNPTSHGTRQRRSPSSTWFCPSLPDGGRSAQCRSQRMGVSIHARASGPGSVALRSYHGAEIPYVFDTHDDWLAHACGR
ncbi:MAG: carboxylesterase family protein [Proteobacteria bacterium]|nr:carboxylesterase family protein [Pseudomonadota bacterium]